MATDNFGNRTDSVSSPARALFTITPHDSNELAMIPKAIYVGTAGNITLRGVDSATDVVLKNVAAGQVIDVRAQYVRATGTTAADLVGLA